MRSASRVSPIIVAVAALAVAALGVAAPALLAQDVVFPGSTVQGDILRGQGQFLKGAAMYDLYSARGRAIDVQTEIMVQRWNAEVYNAYMRERVPPISNTGRTPRSLRGCEFFDECTAYATALMGVNPSVSMMSDVRHTSV
jgi:hypothetical protein